MRSWSKKYSVMSGEPQLGSVRETTLRYDKDDICEALTELFEDDTVDTSCSFKLGEEPTDITDVLTEEDIDLINDDLARLLDDDWGTSKTTDIISKHLDSMIPNNVEIEFEHQEYC